MLIAQAIAAGLIPDEVPGFAISRKGQKVRLEAEGAFAAAMSVADAVSLAEQLEGDVAKPAGGTFNLDAGFITTRRGGAIKLRHIETSEERTLTPSVARDLARLLRMVAA